MLNEINAKRFNPQQIYEARTLTDTLKELEGNSTFKAGKDAVIIVEVNDKDPKRAASFWVSTLCSFIIDETLH